MNGTVVPRKSHKTNGLLLGWRWASPVQILLLLVGCEPSVVPAPEGYFQDCNSSRSCSERQVCMHVDAVETDTGLVFYDGVCTLACEADEECPGNDCMWHGACRDGYCDIVICI